MGDHSGVDLWRRPARDLYLWACERLYHEFAWSYEWVAAGVSLGAWSTWRRCALDHAVGARWLELGPGPGALLAEAQRFADLAMGLERSAQMVASVQRMRRDAGPLPLVMGDARALPFDAGSVDTVIATFPAPPILQRQTLAEVARVLAPGGRFVVVGLWVEGPSLRVPALVACPLGGLSPLPGGAVQPEVIADMGARLAAAGLGMQLIADETQSRLPGATVGARVGGFVAARVADHGD